MHKLRITLYNAVCYEMTKQNCSFKSIFPSERNVFQHGLPHILEFKISFA